MKFGQVLFQTSPRTTQGKCQTSGNRGRGDWLWMLGVFFLRTQGLLLGNHIQEDSTKKCGGLIITPIQISFSWQNLFQDSPKP